MWLYNIATVEPLNNENIGTANFFLYSEDLRGTSNIISKTIVHSNKFIKKGF